MRFYHVAGEGYEIGDPLLCRDRLELVGIVTAWKWDADEGYDGDVVCLFESFEEADAFAEIYGGTVLAVTIPDGGIGEPHEAGWAGYVTPTFTRVAEGYPAVRDGIPAAWLSMAQATGI